MDKVVLGTTVLEHGCRYIFIYIFGYLFIRVLDMFCNWCNYLDKLWVWHYFTRFINCFSLL